MHNVLRWAFHAQPIRVGRVRGRRGVDRAGLASTPRHQAATGAAWFVMLGLTILGVFEVECLLVEDERVSRLSKSTEQCWVRERREALGKLVSMIVRANGLIRRTDPKEKEGRGRSSELHLLIERGWPCSCDTHGEHNSRVI
jgi:hypothetical protein